MEDHHPVGLAQNRLQAFMDVIRHPPALPRMQERRDHVALHRPWPKQRDVDDDVVEGGRSELAD